MRQWWCCICDLSGSFPVLPKRRHRCGITTHPTSHRNAPEPALHSPPHVQLIFGPAEDGGYYLIGASAPVELALFEGIEWSTETVLAQNQRNAARLGLAVAPATALPTLTDIDTQADMARWVAARERQARQTAGDLGIGDNDGDKGSSWQSEAADGHNVLQGDPVYALAASILSLCKSPP
jgi:hypothetical protein